MNIYALKGHSVKVTSNTRDNGTDYDKEMVSRHLEIQKAYMVDRTEVNKYSTKVFLQGFPNIRFNSTNFEDVFESSDELDKYHPDWHKYNFPPRGEQNV